MKDFNLTKSKFHYSEISFNENINIEENNYTFIVVNSKPPQDLEFDISEKNSTNGLEKLTNYTINEFIHNSNIFYERSNLQMSENRNTLYYKDGEIINKTNKDKYTGNYFNKFDCKINYTGIKFNSSNEDIDRNLINPYKEIINLNKINFVLFENMPGIFVEKYLDGKIVNRTSLQDILDKSTSPKYQNFNFKEIKISKLIKSFRYEKNNVIALDEAYENLFIFNLSEEKITNQSDVYSTLINVKIELVNVLKNSSLNKIILKNINSGYLETQKNILILTEINENNSKTGAINIINYNNTNDEINSFEKIQEFKNPANDQIIQFDIISTGFTHNVCFIAIKNFGVLYYNWKSKDLGVLFEHKKVSHLDYLKGNDNHNKKNIGVYLNSDENDDESKEFFIELIKTDFLREQYLNVNKIFYSNGKNLFNNNPNENILDEYGDINFMLSNKENKIYYIKRNLPFNINNIDSKIDLPEELRNQNPIKFKMFTFVSVFKIPIKDGKFSYELKGILKFQTENKIISYFDFRQNEQSEFNCNLNLKGNYQFTSTFGKVDWNSNLSETTKFTAKLNISLKGIIDEDGGLSFGYIILILVVLGLIIVGIIYRKKRTREMEYQAI
jgi:hypothetical protein